MPVPVHACADDPERDSQPEEAGQERHRATNVRRIARVPFALKRAVEDQGADPEGADDEAHRPPDVLAEDPVELASKLNWTRRRYRRRGSGERPKGTGPRCSPTPWPASRSASPIPRPIRMIIAVAPAASDAPSCGMSRPHRSVVPIRSRGCRDRDPAKPFRDSRRCAPLLHRQSRSGRPARAWRAAPPSP